MNTILGYIILVIVCIALLIGLPFAISTFVSWSNEERENSENEQTQLIQECFQKTNDLEWCLKIK